ncbi:MAG: hypothetical protein J0I84_20650 [Terrimonas sp.]|nr:hypothetical protein [Terrimonas sp.]
MKKKAGDNLGKIQLINFDIMFFAGELTGIDAGRGSGISIALAYMLAIYGGMWRIQAAS